MKHYNIKLSDHDEVDIVGVPKPQPELYLGKEVADMHYGWEPVQKKFEVGPIVNWHNYDGKHTVAFVNWLDTYHGMYSNKMLILVAEPDMDGYWTAAWSYDGRTFGVVKLKERT